jgi:ribonuclease-3
MTELRELQKRLGLAFSDKSLLQRAFTHRSYLNEHPDAGFDDNERLEFLGDAVLDFVTGEYLYHRFPEMPEGHLTSLRAALVRRETLARFARKHDLGDYLLMGKGESDSGGRERDATLCAALEALVGAIYLDLGIEAVHLVVEPLIRPEVERILVEHSDRDPKSLLQEYAQANMGSTPRYATVGESGPDHAPQFTVEVTISGQVYGQGSGRTKQRAAQEAARLALEHLDLD